MNSPAERGPLDGRTILRFAHAFDSGGGTERYLDDLDRALLDRSAMTVVRVYLRDKQTPPAPTEEKLGRGRLVRVRVPVRSGTDASFVEEPNSFQEWMKRQVRSHVLYNSIFWTLLGARFTAAKRLRAQPGEAIGAGAAIAQEFRARRIDMVMLHFFGGADADEVIDEAAQSEVPVTVLNHYSNDRFLHLPMRKHVMRASGVAGVNGLEVPQYLANRFVNLSDGIDTEFFQRSHARAVEQPLPHPVILLPARVIRTKGQMDLVKAVAALRQRGIACSLAFAGRIDSSSFVDELRQQIAGTGQTESVRFLGDLSVEKLRDWYAASDVVAFPTYHHEGLGRVTVEAQAMGVPVVAYATGGVPEGLREGETGFLVPTGDVNALTGKLQRLLEQAALRQEFGEKGRCYAQQFFSVQALAERHEHFYLQNFKAG